MNDLVTIHVTRETFSSQNEMKDRMNELESIGRKIMEIEDIGRGLVGYLAVIPESEPNPNSWNLLEFPIYGKPLQPLEILVSNSEEVKEAFRDHSSHESFRIQTDPETKTVEIYCHCLAKYGKSLIWKITVDKSDCIPQKILDSLFSNSVKVP